MEGGEESLFSAGSDCVVSVVFEETTLATFCIFARS